MRQQTNTPRGSSNLNKGDSSPRWEDQNTVLSSARVVQLKKEIDDLDVRLAMTNSINFEDINAANSKQLRSAFQYEEAQGSQGNKLKNVQKNVLTSSHGQQHNARLSYDQYSKPRQDQSRQVQNKENQPSLDLRGSVHIYNQISQNASLNNGRPSFLDQSSLEGGEVSFDIEKITQIKNLNLKSALQQNLNDKRDLITDIERKIRQIHKECEVKNLKLTHLRFERDNIINHMQVESIKKNEQSKEAMEELKRIEVKKREDERAYSIAQNEIRRQIQDQSDLLQKLGRQIDSIMSEHTKIQLQKSAQNSKYEPVANETIERMNQQDQKLNSLKLKKIDVERNVHILRNFLKTIAEEIQMTQEDLSGKLMQRAEFVAQREELDEMYDSGRLSFGKCFELFLKINDIDGVPSGSQSSRFMATEYETQKAISFFSSLLQQIKQQSKSKLHDTIDQVLSKIENSSLAGLDTDKCLSWICQLGQQLNLELDKKVLHRRLELSNKEKDELFHQRLQQLRDIILEIQRFEKMIKDNSNMVDNMILPQLKAMSSTYTEHKNKYKKLKQASFVLRERIKKAEKEFVKLTEEATQAQRSETSVVKQLATIEHDLNESNSMLRAENEEMERLRENADNIEKEFRRAQQILLSKEREVQNRLSNSDQSVSQSLNATQISVFSNTRQQEIEEERLRKRFGEIEDKIRIVLVEKEDADIKLKDYKKLLFEAKESCEHAHQVVVNSHRVLNGGIANKPMHEEAYQVTSFTDNDQLQDPYLPIHLTKQPFNSSRPHEYQLNQPFSSSVTQVNNMIQSQNFLNKGPFFGDHKENALQGKGKKKESITKLDLSKVIGCKDNQASTFSDQRSASQYQSNNLFYEPINYEKMNEQYNNQNQDSTTTMGEVSNNQSRSGIYKRPIAESQQHEINMFNDDLMQQSKFINESQNNNNSSVMNLSELIVSNNPALKNILQLAASHEKRKPSDAKEHRHHHYQGSSDASYSQGKVYGNPHLSNNRQSQSSMSSMPLRDSVRASNDNQQHLLQVMPYDNHHLMNLNQSSIVADNSLINYLDEMNFEQQNHHQARGLKHCPPGVRRTSIETAEFIHTNENLFRKYPHQTIDVDLSHRQQLDHLPMSAQDVINNHQYQGVQNYSQSSQMLMNPQTLTHSSYRSQQQRQSGTSKNTWMSKYLNTGATGVDQMSRMYGAPSFLEDSVSPQINLKRDSKMRHLTQAWDRSSSLEGLRQSSSASYQFASNQGMPVTVNPLHYQSYAPEAGLSYSRSSSVLNRKSKKLNKSMNGIESASLLQQSSASYLNPVMSSVNYGNNFSSIKTGMYGGLNPYQGGGGPESIQFSKVDVSFAERIVPLLDGAAFYKKFSSKQSLNENAFDPLNADKFPPETCGYGVRLFQLDKSLMCINVRMSLKIAVETTISLNDIVKPILPQTTMDIIRAQKHSQQSVNGKRYSMSRNSNMNSHINLGNKNLLEEFLIFESKGSISHLAKIGIVNKNSELYRQKCLDSTYYPFSIALTNGRVELIATSYETLKNWIIGINLLVSNKKHIPKLKQLMELKLD